MPFYRFFFGGGFPTRIDDSEKKGTLILTSLLEDLAKVFVFFFSLGNAKEHHFEGPNPDLDTYPNPLEDELAKVGRSKRLTWWGFRLSQCLCTLGSTPELMKTHRAGLPAFRFVEPAKVARVSMKTASRLQPLRGKPSDH